jgi:hypothetical protein
MADSYTSPDVYGQVHPIESDELVQRKLQELETHLAEIAQTAAAAYGEAQTKCPQLIANDNFKLVLLRCEQFNAKLAAERFVQYWEKRVEIYGAERAFLPLTLQTSGAFPSRGQQERSAADRPGHVVCHACSFGGCGNAKGGGGAHFGSTQGQVKSNRFQAGSIDDFEHSRLSPGACVGHSLVSHAHVLFHYFPHH